MLLSKAVLSHAAFLLVGASVGFLGANYWNRSAVNVDPNAQPHPQVAAPQGTTVASVMSDVTEAIAAAQASPGDFDLQMKVADMYLQIRRADKAEPFLDTAAGISGLKPEQSLMIANGYFDIRRFDKARPFYARALESKPDDVNIRADYGMTFAEGASPDFPRAYEEFEAALRLNPRHEPTLHNIGIAQLKQGDRDAAVKTLERLEAANPGNELSKKLKQAIDAQP